MSEQNQGTLKPSLSPRWTSQSEASLIVRFNFVPRVPETDEWVLSPEESNREPHFQDGGRRFRPGSHWHYTALCFRRLVDKMHLWLINRVEAKPWGCSSGACGSCFSSSLHFWFSSDWGGSTQCSTSLPLSWSCSPLISSDGRRRERSRAGLLPQGCRPSVQTSKHSLGQAGTSEVSKLTLCDHASKTGDKSLLIFTRCWNCFYQINYCSRTSLKLDFFLLRLT